MRFSNRRGCGRLYRQRADPNKPLERASGTTPSLPNRHLVFELPADTDAAVVHCGIRTGMIGGRACGLPGSILRSEWAGVLATRYQPSHLVFGACDTDGCEPSGGFTGRAPWSGASVAGSVVDYCRPLGTGLKQHQVARPDKRTPGQFDVCSATTCIANPVLKTSSAPPLPLTLINDVKSVSSVEGLAEHSRAGARFMTK